MPTPSPTVDVETAARLRVAIGRMSRRLRTTASSSAAGLTSTRISVLLTVVRLGPIRLSELASIESLNPTMLSRAISALVQEGLLTRSSDDDDRRAAWVQTTPAGTKLVQRLRRERTDALDRALEELSGEDRRLIEQALPALEAMAEQLQDPRP